MTYLNVSKFKIMVYSFLINLADDLIACWRDNQGSLFPNFQTDYVEYRKLKIDCSVKSINPNDLPEEFSKGIIKEINRFRRKTANLNNEWMLYIDYENGEILECIKEGAGEVTGVINLNTFKNRKAVSIHNHPEDFLSPPSYDNFELLRYDFEDYEIICAKDEFWIIEAKGILNNRKINVLRKNVKLLYENSIDYSKDDLHSNEIYGDNLLKYLKNKKDIKLMRKRLYNVF